MNGYITLDSKLDKRSLPSSNFTFPHGVPVLAPLWTDIDTSAGGGSLCVDTYDATTTSNISSTIYQEIKKLVKEQDKTDFNATFVMVATWNRVPPFPASVYNKFEVSRYLAQSKWNGNWFITTLPIVSDEIMTFH